MKSLRTNDNNKVVINSKEDMINWLEYMLYYQGMIHEECMVAPSEKKKIKKPYVKVYVDEVIRKRYKHMIDFLKSDQVA